jgi:predicted DsbA family dithiol-disulfide isomerase
MEATEVGQRSSIIIIIISDFVCPWCYIGLAEVERLKQEYDFDIEFAPFLLDPTTPPEGKTPRHITRPEDPPTRIEQRGETLGLKFSRGRTKTCNSHIALEAAEFAGEYGDQWSFHKRMFKAYFEDLEDISDIETVVRIGAEAGLPAESLRKVLLERVYRDRVDEGLDWSRSIGVTAVPTFVFNEQYGMVGAQELPSFRLMMNKIGQAPRA